MDAPQAAGYADAQSRAHPTLADKRVLALISPANWGRLLEIESGLGAVFPNLECVAPGNLDKLQELVRESHGRKEVLLAVGGDGTLHRVLQQVDLAHQIVGLVPGGTGNDLARSMGFPSDMPGRVRHLINLKPTPTDICTLGGLRFHNSGGFGLDSATLAVREQPHGLFRRNYNLAFAAALCTLRPQQVEVEIDGAVQSGSYWWVLAMNNRVIGRGTRIAPRASLDDGLLDLILVADIPRLELLRLLPKAVRGEHIGHPAVTYLQARWVVARTEKPIARIACDGELYEFGRTELEFGVMPGALKLLR